MMGVPWRKSGRGREQGSGTRARDMGGTLCDDNAREVAMHGGV